MLMNRLKTIFNFDGLKVTQYAFIVIAALILIFVYAFSSTSIDALFENPVLTVQMLLVLSYPFCYLLLKSIREKAEVNKEEQILPLWILLLCQITSMNLVCIGLLAYGIAQLYGKQFISLKAIKLTKSNRGFVISMLPIVGLYAIILFVRFRLGML